MKKNSKFQTVALLLPALLALSGLVYGCYSKGSGAENTNTYGQAITSEPMSEEAIRKFTESVRIVDGEAEAHYKLALYFQERWRHKLAIDELKQVLMRNPVHARAYNALGVSSDNLGDHEAAIDYYKLALRIDSKLDYTYNNLGYSYLLKGDNQRAIEAFQQAIALNAKEKRYRNNLGLAYVKQDKFELAYEQFSALDSPANAQKTIAKVMQDLGKGSQTERVLLAVKSTPKPEAAAASVEPANKLPELMAAKPGNASENDPVDRFRSVNGNITLASSNNLDANTAEAENPGQTETAAEQNEDNQKEVLAGPVINLSPAGKKTAHVIETAVASDPIGLKVLAAENTKDSVDYYHVASAAFAQEPQQDIKPQPAGKSVLPSQEKLVVKQTREILPPKGEIAGRVNQEEHEERILLAASSTKAGGWQNAPEPKRTAEKGLIAVEVANGNGVKGAAAKVAEHLRRNGFSVVKVMDANSFDHFNTKVFYYGGSLQEVQRLLKAIPEITGDAELYELQNMGNHIRLLIGKDLVDRNSALTWGKPRSLNRQIGG
jgi:tetratricopeptide (TPR) repeat protein